jgi:MFS-type transporter involved in bile tolerance (Atg22 family)
MMSALLMPILTKNIGYYSVLVFILVLALLTALTPIFARFYIKDEIV